MRVCTGWSRTAIWGFALALATTATLAPSVLAQDPDLQRQIAESQRRLEEIRAERAKLQAEMDRSQSQARDVSIELENIERQLNASVRAVQEIDFQVSTLTSQIEDTEAERQDASQRLVQVQQTLYGRLRDIYKLGSLHTVRVLVGARSFSDLLNRYKYLRLIAMNDRSLVDQQAELEGALAAQSVELQEALTSLDVIRRGRSAEVNRLRAVENERTTALENFLDQGESTLTRLQQLQRDEGQLTGLIENFEGSRVEEETRRVVSGATPTEEDAPALSSEDAGVLEWPVAGDLVYSFGRETRPDGNVLRWNGIGIGAAPGTPVQAVRAGSVVMAGPFEGYGPSVVISHGDGFYTLYLYLEEVGVVQGRQVEAGQIIGTVGGRDTPEGPHIEFQIRAPVAGGTPQARDPLMWLKPAGSE